jgi:hypothetical protein
MDITSQSGSNCGQGVSLGRTASRSLVARQPPTERVAARCLLLHVGGRDEAGPPSADRRLRFVRSGSELSVRYTALVPGQRPSTGRPDRRRRECRSRGRASVSTSRTPRPPQSSISGASRKSSGLLPSRAKQQPARAGRGGEVGAPTHDRARPRGSNASAVAGPVCLESANRANGEDSAGTCGRVGAAQPRRPPSRFQLTSSAQRDTHRRGALVMVGDAANDRVAGVERLGSRGDVLARDGADAVGTDHRGGAGPISSSAWSR